MPAMADTTKTAVNYTALERPISVQDARWKFVGWIGVGIMFVGFVLGIGLYDTNQAASQALVQGGFFGGLVIAAMGFIAHGMQIGKLKGAAFDQFLTDNGWNKTLTESTDNVATSLLGVGHDTSVGSAFMGSYKGVSFTAVIYHYTTGSGKSEQTHQIADVHFSLSKQFPLVVLDDKHNNTWVISDLPGRIPNGVALQTEGNFNERYKVTVLPDTQQTVLEWMTPDFMSELMDNSAKGDIEIESNNLYIVCPSSSFDETTLRNLFGTADVVLKHLSELSDSWQTASSTSEVQQIAETAMTPRLKVLGRNRGSWAFAAVVLIGWLVFGPLQGSNNATLSTLGFLIFMMLIVGYGVISSRR